MIGIFTAMLSSLLLSLQPLGTSKTMIIKIYVRVIFNGVGFFFLKNQHSSDFSLSLLFLFLVYFLPEIVLFLKGTYIKTISICLHAIQFSLTSIKFGQGLKQENLNSCAYISTSDYILSNSQQTWKYHYSSLLTYLNSNAKIITISGY